MAAGSIEANRRFQGRAMVAKSGSPGNSNEPCRAEASSDQGLCDTAGPLCLELPSAVPETPDRPMPSRTPAELRRNWRRSNLGLTNLGFTNDLELVLFERYNLAAELHPGFGSEQKMLLDGFWARHPLARLLGSIFGRDGRARRNANDANAEFTFFLGDKPGERSDRILRNDIDA